YVWQRGRFMQRQGEIDKVLALSAAKLRAVAAILEHEYACQAEDLRSLILTDFETTHAPGGRAAKAGILDPEAGGAIAVMRLLCAELPQLRPVLVTGRSLLIAVSLQPDFATAASAWFSERGLHADLGFENSGDFVRVLGSGPDWSSSTYLSLVTGLFEQGLSLCLIGTRGLLGEGWDCHSLNTLVDLTAVSSFVAVNQIRGRSLRQDPRAPLKVANNWDVVAILPELAAGFRDLERFIRKHAHYYGLCDDGRLEQGVGHVHAIFDQPDHRLLLQKMAEINTGMLVQAGQRAAVHAGWKVGQAYRNQELSCLQLRLPEAVNRESAQTTSSRQPAPPLRLPGIQQAHTIGLALELQRRQYQLLGWQSLSLGPGLILLLMQQPVWMLAWLVLSQLQARRAGQFSLRRLEASLSKARNQPPDAQSLLPLARTVLAACQAEGLTRPELSDQAIQLHQRQDGHLRLHLEGSDPEESRHFVQALQELLEPVQEQRYVLALPQHELSLGRGRLQPWRLICSPGTMQYLPLPRIFARSRERAEVFLAAFIQYAGTAELVYTRQGAGRELLQKIQRQRPFA
ncbi:MAG TPA: hypothetical protein V6D23_03220, partial [Candidatus Obscuribacterales bacterium]